MTWWGALMLGCAVLLTPLNLTPLHLLAPLGDVVFSSNGPTMTWLRKNKESASAFGSLSTPILIAIGGFFAWYKFIRQGEHDPRLQATVTTEEVTTRDNVAYMIVKLSVENSGQVDVNLVLEPSALYLMGRSAGKEWSDPEPDHTYDVFVGQSKVQVNATIEDEIWIERSLTDEVALRLRLAIAGDEGRDWRTSHIISLLDGEHLAQNG